MTAWVIDLSLSFPRRRESIGHHSDPRWGSFLESTEPSMPGSIFSGASNEGRHLEYTKDFPATGLNNEPFLFFEYLLMFLIQQLSLRSHK